MSWGLWLGLAIALAAIEVATVDFVFVMLAGGAVGGSVAAALGASGEMQVLVAVIVAMLLLGLVRPAIKRRFTVTDAPPMGAAGKIGMPAVVVETVSERTGRVKLAGNLWSARTRRQGETFEPGAEVVVVALDGATVVVSTAPTQATA